MRFGSAPVGRVIATAVNAFLIYGISKGYRHVRNVFALFLLAAIVGAFFEPASAFLSVTTDVALVLTVVGVILLYTPATKEWFQ